MTTDDLDTALVRSTTPAIDAELTRMSREAERLARPSLLGRLGRRGIALGAVALLLAGGGTAAAATNGFPFWWSPGWDNGTTVTLASGESCEIAISIGSTPNLAPRATAAGREYLKAMDLDSISVPASASSADCTAESQAIGQTVIDKVTAELVRRGYDVSHLGFGVGAHWDPKR